MSDESDADSLNHLAVRLQYEGRGRESMEAFQRAADLFHADGNISGEARCLNGVGALHKDLGNLHSALIYLERALPMRILAGDRLGEAITLLTLGPVYMKLGRAKEAHDSLMRSVTIARDLQQPRWEGEALYNLAVVVTMSGWPARAFPLLKDALEIARGQRNPAEMAKCLNALASNRAELGETQEALSYSLQVLRFAESVGDKRAQSVALHEIGGLLWEEGRQEESRKCWGRSIAIDLEMGARGQAAVTMASLSNSYLHLDLGQARGLAEQAESLARESGNKSDLMEALSALGQVRLEEGDPQAALGYLDEALKLAHETGFRKQEGGILFGLGMALHRAGDCEGAFARLEDAIAVLEEPYSELGTDALRLSYFNAFPLQNVYYTYISYLVKYSIASGDSSLADRAFNVSERRHARGLREYLRNSLQAQRSGNAYAMDSSGAACPVQQEVHTLPQTAKAPDVAEVQERLLDERTALLEYSLHDGVSYLWVLTQTDHVALSLPRSGAEIRDLVSQLRQALLGGSGSYVEPARELYEVLVRPAEHWIQGKIRLVIIPDRALHLLPFQLLLSGPFQDEHLAISRPEVVAPSPSMDLGHLPGRPVPRRCDQPYLIRDYCITYGPSAGALQALGPDRTSNGAAPRDLIAYAPVEFATGDLPGTRNEVDGISGLFEEGGVLLRKHDSASKQNVLNDRLRDYRYVHFATHASVNDEDPSGSGIVLRGDTGEDQLMRSSEIANLVLNADMVVLSACETALGKVAAGEGVLGLVRAFFYAGARSVCASMWKVDDEATSILMERLYGNIVREGLPPAEALREAQLELIRTGQWSSPLFWASFTLAGV